MTMLIPDVAVEVQDGALGLLPVGTDEVQLKIGVSSAGTQNLLYSFNDIRAAIDALGQGPLVEAVATALSMGGVPVYAIRGAASSAGTVGAVATTRVGASDGTLAVNGTPLDTYEVIVEITRSGSVAGANAAFRYTLDGGDTFSPEIALVANYPLPGTGISLAFTDGIAVPTFEKGDRFTFVTVGPAMTLTDISTALDAAIADPREWSWVHIVGTATPTIAAGVAAKMLAAEQVHRFVFAVLEARDINQATDALNISQWRSNLIAEWANFADVRAGVVAGHQELVSPITGRVHRRNGAWAYTGRLADTGVATHPGQVIDGPVPGIVSLLHDEQAAPSLDQEGFTTFRTIIGRAGFYITQGRMKAPEGSDFSFVTERRVMDKACRIARNGMLRFLNSTVRVDGAGNILEQDARAIEAYIDGQLLASLVNPGEASASNVRIKRDTNVLSTRATTLTVRLIPLGYLSYITVDIGFTNPSLAVAAA